HLAYLRQMKHPPLYALFCGKTARRRTHSEFLEVPIFQKTCPFFLFGLFIYSESVKAVRALVGKVGRREAR
ncbi:MAG: hypothetical protein IJU52_07295, partial [Clostridia bacterium]|nr:hypothetical protein [Clostridia bacterium]